MPANIVPVNAWTTPLTGPANGDPVDGGVGAPSYDMGQKIANRVEFLKEHVDAAESQTIRFPLLHLNPVDGTTVTAGWAIGAAGAAMAINQVSAAGAYVAMFELVQPKHATLIGLIVSLAAAAGHGALPATMPVLTLLRQDTGSLAAPTMVATATDASASVAAYEAPHIISLGVLAEVLAYDSGLRYFLKLAGETGAGSVAGLALTSIIGDCTP